MKKSRLAGLYSGIETLKNGMLYDKRYTGSFEYIACGLPRVPVLPPGGGAAGAAGPRTSLPALSDAGWPGRAA